MTTKRDWGGLHRRSLQRNQLELFEELHQAGELEAHLAGIDRDAQEMFDLVSARVRERNPTWTDDQVARVAEELVLNDLVLVKDAETLKAEREGGYLD